MTLTRKAKVLFIIRVLLFSPAALTSGRETGFTRSSDKVRIGATWATRGSAFASPFQGGLSKQGLLCNCRVERRCNGLFDALQPDELHLFADLFRNIVEIL